VTPPDDRDHIDRLAAESVGAGDATAWFDEVYKAADSDASRIPWADEKPNRWLVEWLDREKLSGSGSAAVVVGCGLGDDAEELARRGLDVTGFDISETAIGWAKRRFPDSQVQYRTADLFGLPASFEGAFDFVFEAYTLQPLPESLRSTAIASVASLAAPGGTILVVTRGRDDDEPLPEPPPWPLSRAELSVFDHAGLLLDTFDDYVDPDRDPPIRRFRARYIRPLS
jgi:SAM-dependent methyltransferase